MNSRLFIVISMILLLAASVTEAAQSHTKGRAVKPLTPELKPGDYVWHPEVSPTGPVVVFVSLPRPNPVCLSERRAHRTLDSEYGQQGKTTPTGVFTVLQKKVQHDSSIYKGAQMPHMQRLTWTGIALHAGNLPGYPAPAGCVRLPVDFAAKLYTVTALGTTVIIADNRSAPARSRQPGLLLAVKSGGTPASGLFWAPEKAPRDRCPSS